LAIDLGLTCGMALYSADGRLISYRSLQCCDVSELKRAAARIMADLEGLVWMVTEGDYTLAAIWERAAMKQGVRVQRVSAEAWRQALLGPQRLDQAKKHAVKLARQVIDGSQAPKTAALRLHAADAICVGLWAAKRMGLLTELPTPLANARPMARAVGL
jgi:hypothetical protein